MGGSHKSSCDPRPLPNWSSYDATLQTRRGGLNDQLFRRQLQINMWYNCYGQVATAQQV
jgi:hypothetical protein